jgi:hypothetical protein
MGGRFCFCEEQLLAESASTDCKTGMSIVAAFPPFANPHADYLVLQLTRVPIPLGGQPLQVYLFDAVTG